MGAKTAKRQQEIPGTDGDSIEELDEVAGPYTTALYQRQELQTKENLLRAQLAERMDQIGIQQYTYRDGEARYTVTRETAMKLKCKREVDVVED